MAAQSAQRAAVPATPASAKPDAPVAPAAGDHMLDRVIAIVNGDVILDSDVDEEIRFSAFQPVQNGQQAFSREKSVERLINRDLILQQSKLQPQDAITDEEVDKDLAHLRKDLPECEAAGCTSDAGWQKVLAAHGFTEQIFRSRWRERMEVLRFIDERFRAGIRVTPAEIQNFYEKDMLPEYSRRGVKAPPQKELEERIELVLLQQQVSALLGDWLKSLRAQGSVVVLKQGEVAP